MLVAVSVCVSVSSCICVCVCFCVRVRGLVGLGVAEEVCVGESGGSAGGSLIDGQRVGG